VNLKLFAIRYELEVDGSWQVFGTVVSADSEAGALKHFNQFAGGLARNPRVVTNQKELCLYPEVH
jgi:hypothetical protein